MLKNNNNFKPLNYEIFCGIDESKKSMSVTFVSHEDLVKRFTMPFDSKGLLNYVAKRFSGKRVAFVYEAGPMGFGLYDDITKAGHFCMVTAPSLVPKAPGQKVKTNPIDSRNLAEQLRGGHLKGIRVPAEKYRHLRQLTRLRQKCVKRSAGIKQQIKSLLMLEQIPFPVNDKGKISWSKVVVQQLHKLELAPAIRFKLDRFLCHLNFWHQEVLQSQRELSRFCRNDADLKANVCLLMTVPGIGVVVAIYLLSRIGDWRHLKNCRELGKFFGLIPSEYSTGEKTNRGSITRMGDRFGRSLLIEAAWSAIKQDEDFKALYRRVYDTNPRQIASKKAVVAVARKLTVAISTVLINQRAYDIKQLQSLV
jgi:transposase